MAIPFTQYRMPNGRQVPVSIEMSKEIEDKANFLLHQDCHFGIEVLSTRQISMTCGKLDNDEEYLLSMEVCNNGPEVIESVSNLINVAYKKVSQ